MLPTSPAVRVRIIVMCISQFGFAGATRYRRAKHASRFFPQERQARCDRPTREEHDGRDP